MLLIQYLDIVNENLNEGTDLILSSVSYILPSNVEGVNINRFS